MVSLCVKGLNEHDVLATTATRQRAETASRSRPAVPSVEWAIECGCEIMAGHTCAQCNERREVRNRAMARARIWDLEEELTRLREHASLETPVAEVRDQT